MKYQKLLILSLTTALIALFFFLLLPHLPGGHRHKSLKENPTDLDNLLARGKRAALACSGCHDLSPRRHLGKKGPPLWGIINQQAGRFPGFAYTREFIDVSGKSCLVWTEGAISRFLTNSHTLFPDTSVKHPIVRNPHDRRALLVYLLTLADQGARSPATSVLTKKRVDENDDEIGEIKAESMSIGAHEAEKCRACHDLSDHQRNLVGPPLWGIVGRTAGWASGYCYSVPFLQGTGQKLVWDEQNLYLFLKAPKTFIPGTKMLFDGVPKAEYRVGLIGYLRSLKPHRFHP
ncbi:MAG: hypothetical protein HQL64_03800 [Magnetococcales bacterium]|nr:hypothetical protein [Magnetococcales bacterium]